MRLPRPNIRLLVRQYGPVAAVTWVGLYVLSFVGFSVGFACVTPSTPPEVVTGAATYASSIGSIAAQAGGSLPALFAAAWAATSITGPVRIAAFIAMLPFVARWWKAVRSRS